MLKKRFAIVGASSRAVGMFAMPIATDFSDTCELVRAVRSFAGAHGLYQRAVAGAGADFP